MVKMKTSTVNICFPSVSDLSILIIYLESLPVDLYSVNSLCSKNLVRSEMGVG